MINYQDRKDREMKKELRLIKMSSVEVEEIQWIWYPYIPCGKVTIIQGDPGGGKNTTVQFLLSLRIIPPPSPPVRPCVPRLEMGWHNATPRR